MNLSTSAMSERQDQCQSSMMESRRFKRSAVECYAQLQMSPHQYGGVNYGLSQDLSEGGVKIRTFSQLPVDSSVVIHLGCSDESEPLTMSGSVVWASRDEGQEQWVVGIAFTDINDGTRQRLQQINAPVSINQDDED
ncbi:MAG: PilZ domain-containing protein [Chromatiaceae bacterium]|nr:PilZ domain-containing protein [Chromatiaceae bacterium]